MYSLLFWSSFLVEDMILLNESSSTWSLRTASLANKQQVKCKDEELKALSGEYMTVMEGSF